MRYRFEDGQLDLGTFELRRGGAPVPVEPQVFDVLAYLIRNRDRVVPKEELMDQVWGGRFVSETAVTSRIKQARRALGDNGTSQRLIRTVHGRGYRFVGEVADDSADPPAPAIDSDLVEAPVRYTTSDGLHIAYQITGAGSTDIVLVPGFVSHLELDWADPRHAHFLSRLGRMGRLIRFDKRGTGMSDRPDGLPDLETRMHDVLAVMDAADSRRAVLFGYSEGGPMAVLFAASHPERVSSLVLYGAYAKRTWAPDYWWAQTEDERAAATEKMVSSWDWEADMRMRCPSADAAMMAWWGRRVRAAATPTTVRALMDMNSRVDVRHALSAVRVPTLVLHRRGDQIITIEHARYFAERIPGARLVELDGQDHFVSGDPDQILDPVESFLSDVRQSETPAVALAALLTPSEPAPDRLITMLVASGGRVRHTAERRPLLLFDGPATAVRAGLRALPREPGTALAVHVAEVDRDAPELTGYGVAAALRLSDAAPSGSVWTTSTVRDLLAGSGVLLEPVGDRSLGPAGTLPVFAAVGAR